MRIAVYGGSFNPPHIAHAMVASWVLWTRKAEQVWLVPVYQHAFEGRHDKRLHDFDRRTAWCRAMARDLDDQRVIVSTLEAELPTPSYTIDTLRHMCRQHPEHTFRLIVGADVLPQTEHWKGWDDIEAHFDPIIVGRSGYPSPPGSVVFPEVSSTDIRQRVVAEQDIRHLVTGAVADAMEAD